MYTLFSYICTFFLPTTPYPSYTAPFCIPLTKNQVNNLFYLNRYPAAAYIYYIFYSLWALVHLAIALFRIIQYHFPYINLPYYNLPSAVFILYEAKEQKIKRSRLTIREGVRMENRLKVTKRKTYFQLSFQKMVDTNSY